MQIAIISSSVRIGRNSHRVALFFKQFIEERKIASVEILDLKEFNFPIFEERLKFLENPSADVVSFAESIKKADGIIIVTPEYNGGYPASLKNVIDLLHAEWKRKPVAFVPVSDGQFGGTQVITSLVFLMWKIGALLVPSRYPVPSVKEAYNENGTPVNKEATEKRAQVFIDELLWCVGQSNR